MTLECPDCDVEVSNPGCHILAQDVSDHFSNGRPRIEHESVRKPLAAVTADNDTFAFRIPSKRSNGPAERLDFAFQDLIFPGDVPHSDRASDVCGCDVES